LKGWVQQKHFFERGGLMSKNDQSKNDGGDEKEKESPAQKVKRLRGEIIAEAKKIANAETLSCFVLVTKTKELQKAEEVLESKDT
jgi:hypothetical protein